MFSDTTECNLIASNRCSFVAVAFPPVIVAATASRQSSLASKYWGASGQLARPLHIDASRRTATDSKSTISAAAGTVAVAPPLASAALTNIVDSTANVTAIASATIGTDTAKLTIDADAVLAILVACVHVCGTTSVTIAVGGLAPPPFHQLDDIWRSAAIVLLASELPYRTHA